MSDTQCEPERRLQDQIEKAIARTQDHFFRDQHSEGYWWYPLESNETITAEYVMLLSFLGLNDSRKMRLMGNHILENQRADGTWSIYYGGPGDISTTVEAYFALKLAGVSTEIPEMRLAREFVLDNGGIYETRIFTKIFLALFGCFPWKHVPSLPVEIMLLPPNFIFSVYRFSSWARATLIPIMVLLHKRPVKEMQPACRLDEIRGAKKSKKLAGDWLQAVFSLVDDFVKLWEKLPSNGLRSRALLTAEKWIVDHQEPTGDWAGIQPPMVNSLLALHTLGYPVDHPVIQKGLEALERFCIRRENSLELQACVSPVWDTGLTCLALMASGVPPEHSAVQKGAKWLLDRQIFSGGDWQLRAPSGKPGGWAFEFFNSHYPDVDDSAVVLMVLNRALNGGNGDVLDRLKSGMEWVLAMRSRDGGWGAFDKDNSNQYLNKIPFADLKAMIDPSTADLTGRVLEMMGYFGYKGDDPVARAAIRFIREKQEESGAWWGRWGVNYIYGTWSVLSGLHSIGEDMRQPYIRRAVAWLKNRQNDDGGWGETCDSYGKSSCSACPSTPSQTAWALLALMAAGEAESPEVGRGARFLLDRQKEDGSWEEKAYTGTGFPKYFMIRYHNYRNCFPLLALGKYRGFLRSGHFGGGDLNH